MIILEPFGGLANRMRVIASGIWLKNKLNTKLTVIWNENNDLFCPFHKLFQENENFIIKGKDRRYKYVTSSNATKGAKKVSQTINNLLGIDYCIMESDFYNLIWPGKLDIYTVSSMHKNVYIQTCQEFGDNLFAFKEFLPISAINSKVDLITKKFNQYTIGVHIRGTDNENSKLNSPVELFINKMQSQLKAQKETTFFLCTDEVSVEERMISIFGDRIITYPKELSRRTVNGIQDALVELYSLSKTNKIFGSYWSSFSDIAARINEIELDLVKIVN